MSRGDKDERLGRKEDQTLTEHSVFKSKEWTLGEKAEVKRYGYKYTARLSATIGG